MSSDSDRTGTHLAHTLKSLWWLPMAKGVLAVAAGIAPLVWPGPSLSVLVLLLGGYIAVDAVLTLVNAGRMRGLPGSRAMTGWGVIGIVAAALMLWHPGPVLNLAVVLIGAWVVLTGLLLVGTSITIIPIARRGWIWPMAGGVVSLGLGLAALIHRSFGVTALSWLIGLGLIAYGLVHIGLAAVLRKVTSRVSREVSEHVPTTIEGEVVPDEGQDGEQPTVIEGRIES